MYMCVIILYKRMGEQEYIERQGRKYFYSEADDCWYPVPSQGEYDFQKFVIFISAIVVVLWIAAKLADI